MSCLSKTLIEDVSLTIGEQLQYIGFTPANVGIDTNAIFFDLIRPKSKTIDFFISNIWREINYIKSRITW